MRFAASAIALPTVAVSIFALSCRFAEGRLISQSRRATRTNSPQNTQSSRLASTSSLDWKRRMYIPKSDPRGLLWEGGWFRTF